MIKSFYQNKYAESGESEQHRLSFMYTDGLQALYYVSPFTTIEGTDAIQLGSKKLSVEAINDLSGNGHHLDQLLEADNKPRLRKGQAEFLASSNRGIATAPALPYTSDTEGTFFFMGSLRDVISNGYPCLFIADGVSNYYFGVEINQNNKYSWFSRNNAGTARITTTKSWASDDTLAVIAVRRNSDGSIDLFADGEYQASSSDPDFLWMNNYDFRLTLGGLMRTNNSDFFGDSRTKAVAYYSRVMSDNEIMDKSIKLLASTILEDDVFAVINSSSASYLWSFNVLQSRNAIFRFYDSKGNLFFQRTGMYNATTIDLSWNTGNENIYITIEPTTGNLPLTHSPNFSNKSMLWYDNSLWQVSYGEINFNNQTGISTYGVRWGTYGGTWSFDACALPTADIFEGANQVSILSLRYQGIELDWTVLQTNTPAMTDIDVAGGSNQPDIVTIDGALWPNIDDIWLGLQTIENAALGILTLNLNNTNKLKRLFLNKVRDIVTVNVTNCDILYNIAGFTGGPSALQNINFVGGTALTAITLQSSDLTQATMDALIIQADNDGLSDGTLYFPNENGGYTAAAQTARDNLIAKGWDSSGGNYPL